MSRYQPYPAYKPSGSDWLGDVPEHWETKKIRYIAKFRGGGTPDRSNAEYWNGNIPWVSPKDMKCEKISSAEECITEEGLLFSASSKIPEGSVLMVVRSGILKHTIPVAINVVPICLNQDMKAFILNGDFINSYVLQFFQGYNRVFVSLWSKQGATVESIEHEYLANSPILKPPLKEQKTIADFLDRETARIDALAKKKQELIDRLKEKRAALITRTVTRGLPPLEAEKHGLNPNPPLKPSGIGGANQIPMHWKFLKLKYVVKRITDGAHISPDISSPDFPFVSTVDISDGKIDFENCLKTSEECYEYLVHTGCMPFKSDILFSKDGTIGRTAVINFTKDFVIASSLVILSPKLSELDSFYLNYWLNSDILQQSLQPLLSGAALKRISVEKVSNLEIFLPPLAEQKAIADFLDRETTKIDALIQKVETGLGQLQEYRAALITAAVTGKIDVRKAAGQETGEKAA